MKTMTTMNKLKTVRSLETILATTKVLQYKAQTFHWNIEGTHFFQLHEKFEEFYNRHSSDLDELAERLRQLGAYPASSMKKLIQSSSIEEATQVDSTTMVDQLIEDYQLYSSMLQEFIAEDESDEVSSSITSEIASYIEKQLWMLKSFAA